MLSITIHTRTVIREHRHQQTQTQNNKLLNLSEGQQHPVSDVDNMVVLCWLNTSPCRLFIKTLTLEPNNVALDRFELKIFCEIERLIELLLRSKHIYYNKKYLKENELLAFPFNKGIGIWIMKKELYHQEFYFIKNLPQFEKVVKERKNAK